MKIERIWIALVMGIVYHADSHETKEIKVDKKNALADGLKYLEDYCNNSGFDLFDTFTGANAIFFTIVKK